MGRFGARAAALMLVGLLLAQAPAARAADKIVTGMVGGPTGTMWLYYVGIDEGFFAKHGVELDFVFAPSAPGILQQLTAGSLDIVGTTGVVEPIHAVDKGAPVAIARIIGQNAPYGMEAKGSIGSIKDLKGKTIALGGLVDITKIYWDIMAAQNGLKPGDVDIIVIGATAGRFAALKSGTVDASMLMTPFNFQAEATGFKNIGLVYDYVKDFPFTGLEVSKSWGATHAEVTKRLLAALDESAAWFYAPNNRDALIQIGVKNFNIGAQEAGLSLDYMRKIEFFAPSSKVSKKGLEKLVAVMRAAGDVSHPITADDLVIPGLTELAE
jgi:ABC-type nitrate/sulfonate/bicarbonate transport system substrate-binding protein